MANSREALRQLVLGLNGDTVSGGRQTLALDSGYTAGSAGDAIAAKFTQFGTRTLNNIYFFITGYTGTAANVDDLNWEVRTGNGDPDTSGGGLVASGTVNPSSATGWINIGSLSQSLTNGTIYHVIIADADGNGTDFATVLVRHSGDPASGYQDKWYWLGETTTNGFVSTTAQSNVATLVLAFADGTVRGNPFTNLVTSTSSTNRRGLRIDGLTEAAKVFGFMNADLSSSNMNGAEIFEGTTGPGGSPLASSTTLVNVVGTTAGILFTTPVSLAKATEYRFVFTYSAADTRPRKYEISTGTDATLRKAMPGGGNWYWAEASGTTDWSNDDTSAFPWAAVLIEDQVEGSAFVPDTDTVKRLAGPTLLTTSAATIYTTPASTKTTIRNIHVANESGSAATFTFSVGTDGAGKRLWKDVSIASGKAFDWHGQLTLEAAELVQALAGSSSALVITLSGVEQT